MPDQSQLDPRLLISPEKIRRGSRRKQDRLLTKRPRRLLCDFFSREITIRGWDYEEVEPLSAIVFDVCCIV